MNFILQNISGANLDIDDLGITLLPGATFDLSIQSDPQTIASSASGGDLETVIIGGAVQILDPVEGTTLSTTDALEACRAANDPHWGIRGGLLDQVRDVDVPSPSNGDALVFNSGSGNWEASAASGGDVNGPGSSTDDAIVRWDGTTGTIIQNSNAILDDAGNVDFAGTITGGDLRIEHDSNSDLDLIFDANGRDGATGASLSRDGLSGFLWLFPNSTVTQLIGGDPASGPGGNSFFIDSDMGGNMFLQTLGGAGAGAELVATSGGNLRPAVDTTSSLGTSAFRWGDVHGVDLYGRTLRLSNAGGNEITLQTQAAVFTNYSLTLPPNDGDANQVLTTDGSGVLTWTDKGGDDELVKVSANDTTAGTLTDKLVAGTGVTFTENNDGGNETLTINSTTSLSVQGIWSYDDSTSIGNPGSGNFRINNSNPALATNLLIADETETGVDFSTILGAVQVGDVIYLQNNENGGEALIATVSSVTDNGSWWNYGITVFDSNGSSFTDGKEFGFVFALGVVSTDTGITQLTGDVLAGPGNGVQAATIADDAVTYPKMQNVVANNVLLGNNSGAGSVVEELTATEVRTILNVEDGAAPDQNLFETFAADTGSTTADTTTDTLTIAGGTNVTTTIVGDTLTIDAVGGSGSPGGVDGNVQYNNGGAFGGNSAFNFDDVALEVNILGNAGDTQLTVGGTSQADAGDTDATFYVEVEDPDPNTEGIRTYFNRTGAGAGISGWIANAYDGAAPFIRIVDEDDDGPYIEFDVVGTGTPAAPQFANRFGGRNVPPAGAGGATTGFEWLVGGVDAMWVDTNVLTIPRDTTANRPVTPVDGQIRYNTTLAEFEGYEAGAWLPLISKPKEVFLSHNGAVTQTLTTTFVTALFNTVVRTDSSYSYAAGTLTINKTGWFRVTAEVSADSTGPRSTMEIRLAQNGTPIAGTLGYGYHRNTGNGEDTATVEFFVNITSGDTVVVQIRETAGAVVTVANACRLLVEEVDDPS